MSVHLKPMMAGFVAAVMAAATALADNRGDVRFESGGSSDEAVEAMAQRASQYSLKLTLAAKGSGAYLSDVDVTITALPKGTTVLEHRTQGPLLMAALPPGRYEISASFDDVLPGAATTVKRTVVVPRQGQAQAVLYFDNGD
jgi:hypothetical protein